MFVINVPNYLNGFHEILSTSTLYRIDPFKHENGCVKIYQTPLFNLNQSWPGNTHNKASYAAQTSFKREPHLETQATERL